VKDNGQFLVEIRRDEGERSHTINEQEYPAAQRRGGLRPVSLLVMTVLSVLASVFLWTAQTETTIATNYRNQAVAFNAAEAGIESGLVASSTM